MARPWASAAAAWLAAACALALPAALPSWRTEHLAALALALAGLAAVAAAWLPAGREPEPRAGAAARQSAVEGAGAGGATEAAQAADAEAHPADFTKATRCCAGEASKDEDFFARLWGDVEVDQQGRGREAACRPGGGGRSRVDSPAAAAPAAAPPAQEEDEADSDAPIAELPLLAVLNHASSLEDLKVLRAFGPKNASAVLEHHKRGGPPLRRLEDLVTVVGLGRPVLRKLLAANA